jgi:NAD(P)-dependent dehydrogenase (short-subunit alcohol dehydrogenase family)
VSLAFLDELARVTVTYQPEAELVALRGAAGGHASSLDGQEIDITDEGAVRQLATNVLSRHGRLDVFVNAVGAYAGGTPLWDLDSKVFDKMFTLNLRCGYVLLRAVAPVMLKQKRGAIVSVASRSAFDHVAGAAAYSASKAAAVAMIDSLAADLMGTGVRANSIIPSIIDRKRIGKLCPERISRSGRSPRTSRASSFSSAARTPNSFTAPASLFTEMRERIEIS